MRNKKYAAIGATAVLTFSVGTAYAYWTTTGAGNGSATTAAGAAGQLTVNQTTTPATAELAPGLTGDTLAGTVTNPAATSNPDGISYALTAVKITLTVVKATAPGTAASACDASDYVITSDNSTAAYSVNASGVGTITTEINDAGSPVDLADGATGAAWTSNVAFVNKPAVNQDGCKGATLNFAYETVQS